MLKLKMSNGTPIMEYMRALPPSFWRGTDVKDFATYHQMIKEKEDGTQTYYWIQFPKPHTLQTEFFLDKVLELERYTWFNNYIFNIEFNPHIHSHLILISPSKDIRPSRIINNIAKHLGIKENNIQCKRYSHSYYNRLNYVKGLKIPHDKQTLVELDIHDRKKYNIKTYYSDAFQTETTST